MPDRMAEMREVLRPQASTRVNHDFSPLAYYFAVALWSTQFNQWYRTFFASLAQVPFGVVLAACAILALGTIVGVRLMPDRRRRRAAAGLCVGSMGFILIGLEVLLLLGFQAIYGYVYRQLAVLIAMFMAGMAAGSWRALHRNAGRHALVRLQVAAVAGPLVLYAALLVLVQVSGTAGLQGNYLGEAAFMVLAGASGMLGGLQFPVANRALFASDPGHAGTLYALDLIGACAGALAISGYLIPVFGFGRTAVLMAVVAVAPAIAARLSFEG